MRRRRFGTPCSDSVLIPWRGPFVLLSALEVYGVKFFFWRQVEASEFVPADVIELATGDGVPADCRLMKCMEILANEALLIGESEEVRKALIVEDLDEPFSKNMCFMPTSATNGRRKAIITSTGMSTQVGQIVYHGGQNDYRTGVFNMDLKLR